VVEARIIDGSNFVTVWEGKMGPIKKRFTLEGQILEQSLGRFSFNGEGDGLKIRGTVEYATVDPEKTLLTVDVDIDPGIGIVAGVVNHVIGKEKNDNALYVERKLAESLGAKVELLAVGS
jgi:hypothetical protein